MQALAISQHSPGTSLVGLLLAGLLLTHWAGCEKKDEHLDMVLDIDLDPLIRNTMSNFIDTPIRRCSPEELASAPPDSCPDAPCVCWVAVGADLKQGEPEPYWPGSTECSIPYLNAIRMSVVPGAPRREIHDLAKQLNGRVIVYHPPGYYMSQFGEAYTILIERLPELGIMEVVWKVRSDPRVRWVKQDRCGISYSCPSQPGDGSKK